MKASRTFRKLINKSRFVCRLVGFDSLDPNYKPNVITYLMIVLYVVYVSFLIHTVQVKFKEDWKALVESVCLAGNLMQISAKLIMAIVYSKSIAKITQQLHEIYENFEKTDDYEKILLQSLKKCKVGVALTMFGYILTLIVMWISPLFYYFMRNQKIFPINLLVPGIDINTTTGFFVLYIIQNIIALLGIAGTMVTDSLILLFTFNITLFTDIFRQKILDFNKELQKYSKKTSSEKLRDIVEWLDISFGFTNEVKKIFFWTISVEVFSCAFGAIASIFIIMVGDWPPAYTSAAVNMMSLYIFCVIGTLCENSADETIDMIYAIDWNLLGISDQKVVLLMLIRAQQKTLLTVGEVAPLSVNTALQVTKAIYSYWMMLMNFVE